MHCTIQRFMGGSVILCRGGAAPRCQTPGCGARSEKLCDHPVGNGKTCDRRMCNAHAFAVGDNVDYCEMHRLYGQKQLPPAQSGFDFKPGVKPEEGDGDR